MLWKLRVLFDVTLGHVESCLALRVALGARVGHEHRVPSLSTDGFVPSLVVGVRTLALTIGIWLGTCRLCGRHVGADLTDIAVGKFVVPVLCRGTGAWHCGRAVVHLHG